MHYTVATDSCQSCLVGYKIGQCHETRSKVPQNICNWRCNKVSEKFNLCISLLMSQFCWCFGDWLTDAAYLFHSKRLHTVKRKYKQYMLIHCYENVWNVVNRSSHNSNMFISCFVGPLSWMLYNITLKNVTIVQCINAWARNISAILCSRLNPCEWHSYSEKSWKYITCKKYWTAIYLRKVHATSDNWSLKQFSTKNFIVKNNQDAEF